MGNRGKVPSIALLFVLLCTVCGCTNFLPKKQSINAVYKIEVKDAWLHQLTAVTQRASIEASGLFKAGNYVINGTPLTIEDDTAFELNLVLPIDNPDCITTENAVGKLRTSKPLHAHGISLPNTIVLENGKMTGEVDFVRVFGTFLFNFLQEQLPASTANNMRAMILSLHINKATLDLRPDSFFEKNNKLIHIGQSSKVELFDLVVDKDFNYVGNCKMELNFLPNSKWIGKKVDCNFNGGNAHLLLEARRAAEVLTYSPVKEKKQQMLLEQALFKFGKNKRSSVYCQKCDIDIKELIWQKIDGSPDADLHVLANLKLNQTDLNVRTDRHQTTAYFPNTVPAKIQIDINGAGRQTQFTTIGTALAQKATIEVFRPSSNLKLYLEQAKVGPIAFDKCGNLNLSFTKGIARLKELDWSNGKKYLSFKAGNFSELFLPEGMYMFLSKEKGTRMSLPLAIKTGSAAMNTSSGQLLFNSIDGNINVDMADEIILQGNISFVLDQSDFLGKHRVAVHVNGFDLSPKKSYVVAHFKKCSVTIPNSDLQEVIQEQFPQQKCANVEKTIFKKRHWRYKNAEINRVTLCNLVLQKLKAEGKNSADVIVNGDVVVDGTIDKTSVLNIIKEHKTYKTKPWQIKAHCVGFGKVDFDFVPNSSLSKSELPYTLNINLPIPDDVELDWSQVESGIYKGLEHGIIVSMLKDLEVIPLTYKGMQPLFNKNQAQFESTKLSNVLTKATPGGVQVDFTADATF